MKSGPTLSLIITAWREPRTVGKSLEIFLKQIDFKKDQVLVVAPDKKTLEAAQTVSEKIETLADEGKGKPAALNLALAKAKGEIVVLTDGDVWTNKDSLEPLLKEFKDSKVGIVSGQPVSLNDKNTLLGFWAYFLTQVAHKIRMAKSEKGEYFDASGYLLAARKHLLPVLPKEVLTDDVFFSQKVHLQGYKVAYAPQARVYVKYPTNIKDWVKQKVRSAGGAGERLVNQAPVMRGFSNEVKGSFYFFSLPKTPKEWIWLTFLYLARAYVWMLVFFKIRLLKRRSWPRIESTK